MRLGDSSRCNVSQSPASWTRRQFAKNASNLSRCNLWQGPASWTSRRLAEIDMASCPKCYRSVPDGSLNCPGCLGRVVEIPPVVEIRYVDYLLGELAIWPVRRLVSSEIAHQIYE